jgi:hypothetical protein
VTQAQEDDITVRARASQAEEMVWEKATLLEAARGKEAEADQRASALWGEPVAAHREQDVAEDKVLSLVTKAVVANE